MNLQISKGKTRESWSFYMIKSYRDEKTGKTTSHVVEKLGNMKALEERFGKDDPIGKARKYVKEMTEKEKAEKEDKLTITLSPCKRKKAGEMNSCNVGFLFPKKIYHGLGLDTICEKIAKEDHLEFNLGDILESLIYSHIIYPGSEKSSYETAKPFAKSQSYEPEQIHGAIHALGKEDTMDRIQAWAFRRSKRIHVRKTDTLQYEHISLSYPTADTLAGYESSKSGDVSPTLQIGLLTDADGIPAYLCIKRGNAPEEKMLESMQDKTKKLGIDATLMPSDVMDIGRLEKWALEYRIWSSKEYYPAKACDNTGKDAIEMARAYFLICFLSFLVMSLLEKKVNSGAGFFSASSIANCLRNMGMYILPGGEGYSPLYTRTDLTDALHEMAGIRTDTEIVTRSHMRNILMIVSDASVKREKKGPETREI